MFAVLDDSCIFRNFYGGWSAQFTKDQNQGLVRDVRALLRNCIFGITPERDGM